MTNLDLFKSEWTFTRGLTLDRLDSLSEVELSEPPGRDLGSFWKQFRHVGRLQECYQDALNTGRIKFDYDHKRYRGGCSRDALKNHLQELDGGLLRAIEQVDWSTSINWDGDNIGVFQHLMRGVTRNSSSWAMDLVCPAHGNEAAAKLESVGSLVGASVYRVGVFSARRALTVGARCRRSTDSGCKRNLSFSPSAPKSKVLPFAQDHG